MKKTQPRKIRGWERPGYIRTEGFRLIELEKNYSSMIPSKFKKKSQQMLLTTIQLVLPINLEWVALQK